MCYPVRGNIDTNLTDADLNLQSCRQISLRLSEALEFAGSDRDQSLFATEIKDMQQHCSTQCVWSSLFFFCLLLSSFSHVPFWSMIATDDLSTLLDRDGVSFSLCVSLELSTPTSSASQGFQFFLRLLACILQG